jgi:hypothetical protein
VKKSYLILTFLIMAIIATGCNSSDKYAGNEKNGDYDHQNSTELLDMSNNNKKEEDRAITTDEITDQNPNLLNLNTDHNAHVNNLEYGLDAAKELVAADQNFIAGPIWRNGNRLHVTVYSDGDLPKNQRQQAIAKLEKKLQRALPTYKIDVELKNRR